jgi:trigger factor
MAEVMQDAINATVGEALSDRAERAATQPKVDLPEDQGALNKVLDGESDLNFDVSYEVLPQVEPMDFSGLKLERPVVDISDEDVEKELQRVYRQQRGYEPRGDDETVAEGDNLGIAFEGKIDGKGFSGGSSDHAHVVVGSGEFIPGFEQQLVGMKKGESRSLDVTFPADYNREELRGKTAKFDVTVLHADKPQEGVELNDDFAKRLGLDDLEALRSAIRDQMRSALDSMSRQAVKRQILDALDEGHRFDVPQQLVDAEFDQIWDRVKHEVEEHGRSFEDEGTTEEEARAEYRKIAERRVRLGLVVAEVGNRANVQVSEDEHQQALIAEVRRFPGQEQQVYDYYRKNPTALAGLRAPVFENKVVDYVADQATITEKKVSRDELAKMIQDEDLPDEHDHDHDHEGHDH